MTATRNEAAERLRDEFEQLRSAGLTYQDVGLDLDAALAAERRATVERIRERWHSAEHFDDLWDILELEDATAPSSEKDA